MCRNLVLNIMELRKSDFSTEIDSLWNQVSLVENTVDIRLDSVVNYLKSLGILVLPSDKFLHIIRIYMVYGLLIRLFKLNKNKQCSYILGNYICTFFFYIIYSVS